MWCRSLIAVACLQALGSQAYAPIQMVSGQGKGLVVLPKGFPGHFRGAIIPQKLSVRNPTYEDNPSSIPYFTAKLDQTISWDEMGWCLEAIGSKHGDAVRVTSCSGVRTQKWTWIPDGRGHNMIQLKDTDLCLDAIDKEAGLNGVPIELRVCGSEVVQWQFEDPLPLQGTLQGDDFSNEARHVMIALLTLAGLGAVSLIAWRWQWDAKGSQDQEVIPAVMAVGFGDDGQDAPPIASMQLKAIKQELDERGVTWRGVAFEKDGLVELLEDARSRPPAPANAKKDDANVADGVTQDMPKNNAAAGGTPDGMGGMPGGMGGMPGGMGGIGDMFKNIPGMGGTPGGTGGTPGGMGGIGDMMKNIPGMGGMPGIGAMQEMMSKMMSNPRAMELVQKAQANPKIMQAVQDLQQNGPSAVEKYADDPEVMSVVNELQEIIMK